jgi:hypothetical protein
MNWQRPVAARHPPGRPVAERHPPGRALLRTNPSMSEPAMALPEGYVFSDLAIISRVFKFAENAAPAFAGGMYPMPKRVRGVNASGPREPPNVDIPIDPFRCAVLRFSVSHSTSRSDFNGPVWLMTSVLKI